MSWWIIGKNGGQFFSSMGTPATSSHQRGTVCNIQFFVNAQHSVERFSNNRIEENHRTKSNALRSLPLLRASSLLLISYTNTKKKIQENRNTANNLASSFNTKPTPRIKGNSMIHVPPLVSWDLPPIATAPSPCPSNPSLKNKNNLKRSSRSATR